MTRAEFATILSEMNAGRREAGQVTTPVCEVWRRDAATARVVDAVIAWEIATRRDSAKPETGRLAHPGDMEAVVERRLAFEAEKRGVAA